MDVCKCKYRVFKGVFRGDPLQLFQGTNSGVSPLILAISHQQFVVFTIGYRGTHTSCLKTRLTNIGQMVKKRGCYNEKRVRGQVTLHLLDTVKCIM